MSDGERAHVHALIFEQLLGVLGPGQAFDKATAIIAALDAAANERPGALYRERDIVQINPLSARLPGCLLTVSDVDTLGVTGFLQTEFGRRTMLWASFSDIAHTGGISVFPTWAGDRQLGKVG